LLLFMLALGGAANVALKHGSSVACVPEQFVISTEREKMSSLSMSQIGFGSLVLAAVASAAASCEEQ
jgi:hypothetical protein